MKLTKAAVVSVCVTAVFLVGAAGYLLGLRSGAAPYRVTAERLSVAEASVRAPAVPADPININTADAASLQMLPGIGETRARDIIADREANGPFASPEDLIRVRGIGEATLQALLDYITVE